MYFEGETVSYIGVILEDSVYKDFCEMAIREIAKHGEPKGHYVDEDRGEYIVYWWASDPVCDVRISVSLKQPYTIEEHVFYGK